MRTIFSFYTIVFLFCTSSLLAQITGPTPVTVGTTKTYTFNSGQFYVGEYWYVPPTKGEILNESVNGTTYSVTIKWLTTGSATLSFREEEEPPPAYTQIASKLITVNSCPTVTAPTVSGNYRIGAGTLTLSGNGTPSGGSYQWYSATGTLLATSLMYTTSMVSGSTANYMYVKAINADGCVSAQTWINITIDTPPTITVAGTRVAPAEPVKLTASSGFTSYNWKNAFGDVMGTTAVLTTSIAGHYTVTVTKNGASWTSPDYEVKAQFGDLNYNYIVSHSLRHKVKDHTQIPTLSINQVLQTVQYMDGLGRTIQTVMTQGSPEKNDLVQPIVYDNQGRISKQYLPYGTTDKNGTLKIDPVGLTSGYAASPQYQFYNSAGDKIANDTSPFSVSVVEKSPLSRVVEQGAPGTDWQPGAHTMKFQFRTNTAADNIRVWKSDFTSAATYGVNTLLVHETTDEDNRRVKTFTDKAGRLLEKHVLADGGVWLKTLHVYDELGRLKLTLQPEGVLGLGSSTTISPTLIEEFGFTYVYDPRQRLVEKKTPGSAVIYYGYDPLDRLTVVQDGNMRAQNKWYYIKYDKQHRPIISGIYTNTVQTTRVGVQGLLDELVYTTGETYYEKELAGGAHGYTNQSFPTTGTQVLIVNYYDDYVTSGGTAIEYPNYTTRNLGADEGVQAAAVIGKLTVSKRLILGTSTWLINHLYYDKYGQVIQTRSNNHLSATVDNLTTYVYNFDGSMQLSETYHKAVAGQEVTTMQRYEYDHAGRPLRIWHKIAGQTEVLANAFEYNELGQLVDKKLHSLDNGSTFLQSVDYRYSIRGWLTSINNATLVNDASTNDEDTDYFGMELLYNTQDAELANSRYYNGSIAAQKWKSAGAINGAEGQQNYNYQYDQAGRLSAASYHVRGAVAWDKEANALNERITLYDQNGNIKQLERNQRKYTWPATSNTPVYVSENIDNLNYTYTSGNKLSTVEDTSGKPQGFDNKETQTVEYIYNDDGSMTNDQNKGMATVYNDLGKPQQVTIGGKVITYTYDASGTKLSMTTTASGSPSVTTHYVDGFVYQGSTLQFFGAPQGRVVKNGSAFEYQYSIADHQGNTRVVFSSATPAAQQEFTNFETLNPDFGNYNQNVSGFMAMNHTPAGTNSQLLTGGYNSQVGLAKDYPVYPGDKVRATAYVKYMDKVQPGNLAGFATQLLNAFGLASPAVGEVGTPSAGINGWGSVVASGNGNDDETGPRAFINILLFDRDYNLVDVAYKQVPFDAANAHTLLELEITVNYPGYAYVYLSNENPTQVDVYFDDVTFTYTPTAVIQYNEYYPFGLQTSNSWTRENKTDNRFLYNGGSELNAATQVYETYFRGYDPVLGRFLQVDPKSQYFSSQTPYNFAFNNPVLLNDPNGDQPPQVREGDWWNYMQGGVPVNQEQVERGYHWSYYYRDMKGNLNFMGVNDFESFYGVDLSTNEGRTYVTRSIGTPLKGIIAATDGSEKIDILYAESPQSNKYAWFINNQLVGIYSAKSAYLYADFTPTGDQKYHLMFKGIVEETSAENSTSGFGMLWVAGSLLTVEDAYNNFVHDHKYYITTRGSRRSIYKKPGVPRSPQQAAKYALRSKIVQGVGVSGTVLMTGVAWYNLQNGSQSYLDVTDLSVGTFGLGSTVSSYYGYTIPGAGQGVALYAWGRIWFDLGAKYGPSKWYGSDDNKWFD